jgi:hypothetical protein
MDFAGNFGSAEQGLKAPKAIREPIAAGCYIALQLSWRRGLKPRMKNQSFTSGRRCAI